MNAKRLIFLVTVAAFLVAGVAQWRAAEEMRGERDALRMKAAEVARRRADRAGQEAAKASAAELDHLRDEREAVTHLRREIDELRGRAEERARAVAATGGAAAKPEREPSILEEFAPATAWRNVGQATPSEALQTALWAAAGGDLKTLTSTLIVYPETRAKVHALLDRLPPEMRGQFHDAEEFMALVTTPEVPLGEAHILDPKVKMPEGVAFRVAEFRDQSGQMRLAGIVLRQTGDGWRLVVPDSAVKKSAARLLGVAADGGGR